MFKIDKILEFFGYYKFKVVPKLEEDKKYTFVRCRYMGMWCGFYSGDNPNGSEFVGEKCSFMYLEPERAWRLWKLYEGEILRRFRSMQIKYFISAICLNTSYLYTIIYEANVNKVKVWWTYGQDLTKKQIEGDREAMVIPTKKLWLKDSDFKGYNIHCNKIYAPSMDWRQNFVRWHRML